MRNTTAAATTVAALILSVQALPARAADDAMYLAEMVVRVECRVSEAQGPRVENGTGLRLGRPDLVVTAGHVIENASKCVVAATARSGADVTEDVLEIERPPQPGADLAALILEGSPHQWQYFTLADKPDYELGVPVASYGYPAHQDGLLPRMMFGHVQRVFPFTKGPYGYRAYELGFPAFGGQSGSPVFLNEIGESRTAVLAIVTANTKYEDVRDDPQTASAYWAVGLALFPYVEWIESL